MCFHCEKKGHGFRQCKLASNSDKENIENRLRKQYQASKEQNIKTAQSDSLNSKVASQRPTGM